MWISQLSERVGLPVDTVKHYLRIGVLHKGQALGPLRAEYDESHVSRLLLIKALHDVGRLSLDQIKGIFDAVDASRASLRDAVGRSHLMLSSPLAESRPASSESTAVVDALIESRGWTIRPDSEHRVALAVAIDTLASVRDDAYRTSPLFTGLLALYADHAEQVATAELANVDTRTLDTALNSIVIGTVLFEPVILVIRRLAHENASLDWWAEKPWRDLHDDHDDTDPQ